MANLSVCCDFELEVSFENGESLRFDVKPYLGLEYLSYRRVL